MHCRNQTARGIGLYVNTNKKKCLCFKQEGAIKNFSDKYVKLVDQFKCIGSNISSTDRDFNISTGKAWTIIDRLMIKWKSDLPDKIKQDCIQPFTVYTLLYGCTSWTRMKSMDKRLDGSYKRMLRAVLNKSWNQNLKTVSVWPSLISQTIQVKRRGHAEKYRWSKDQLIRNALLRLQEYTRVDRKVGTYMNQLCADTGCSLEGWLVVRVIQMTWWWWWWWLFPPFHHSLVRMFSFYNL